MSFKIRYTEAGTGAELRIFDEDLTVKVAGDDTDGQFEIFELTCPQGSGAPRSRHPWGEAYYGLAGTFDVVVGRRHETLEPGDTLFIPPAAAHEFVASSESASMLVVSLGVDGGRFFADLDANVHVADGPEVFGPRMAEVADRHSVTLLPDAALQA